LLELIVFGREAGKNAFVFANEKTLASREPFTCKEKVDEENLLENLKSPISSVDFYKTRDEICEQFYKNVGIKRNEIKLSSVRKYLQDVKQQLPFMGVKDTNKIYNTELVEFLEFKNMLELCEMVTQGALERQESRGAHFREDMPNENKIFEKTRIYYKNGEKLCIE
jgi:succinate dehydrogenase / fumarate reductase flavoprotein subunit